MHLMFLYDYVISDPTVPHDSDVLAFTDGSLSASAVLTSARNARNACQVQYTWG